MTMCDSEASILSAPGDVSRRSNTPFVQNNSAVSAHALFSRRIWYPTDPDADLLAALRGDALGHRDGGDAPRLRAHDRRADARAAQASSMRYCGTCVVFPHPVAPAMSTT